MVRASENRLRTRRFSCLEQLTGCGSVRVNQFHFRGITFIIWAVAKTWVKHGGPQVTQGNERQINRRRAPLETELACRIGLEILPFSGNLTSRECYRVWRWSMRVQAALTVCHLEARRRWNSDVGEAKVQSELTFCKAYTLGGLASRKPFPV